MHLALYSHFDEAPVLPHLTASRRHRLHQRALAVLAGGLMLGCGATFTAATWARESYVGATITTADFEVQESESSGDAE
ncbi:hypothetical protein [Nesterenkonia alba]|uniref:hypothetical protein n=1 Tax=Nesterenkonia alba TaxID=515814 RepID=UPI0003B2F6C3|nr:hypothetical protein [Nesterenkonia alba]